MSNDTTEPAFPSPNSQYFGLTKREYFAAMAMSGFLSHPEVQAKTEFRSAIAATSVAMADALIEELSK